MNNWIYKGKEVESIDDLPQGTFAFVYKITNLNNNRTYFGKKQVVSVLNKAITKKDRLTPEFADKRKKKKQVIKEMKGWMEYTGSNTELNQDIDDGAAIKKEIIVCCKTKNQATYFETKVQFSEGVLEDDLSYNDNILGKFYRKSLKDENAAVKV